MVNEILDDQISVNNESISNESSSKVEPNSKVFDGKILSSCYINLFFGAGVNGAAFPSLAGFSNTLSFLKKNIKDSDNKSFEEMFNELSSKAKEQARKKFIKEFKNKEEIIDFSNDSILHLRNLFAALYKLVDSSENRIRAMKQINIFTANYDFIAEETIKNQGYLCNYVSASNLSKHDKLFNVVGYDCSIKKYIPTFLVSKIHGDINDPVLPGTDKYDSILTANKFEIVFKMKEKLMRENSVLLVVGYSGRDNHINSILKDCADAGLLIYWYKYSKNDSVPKGIDKNIVVIENEDNIDTTLLLTKHLNQLWEKSSEE